MLNVLLVGCGNLGKWHIKGLQTSSSKVAVTVLDPDISVKEKFLIFSEAQQIDKGKIEVTFIASSTQLKETAFLYDLVIVATTAKGRLDVIQDVTEGVTSRFWLLEKPIEQSYPRMLRMEYLLKDEKAWVNHPRRLMPLYKRLQELVSLNENFDLKCKGPRLGIACNSSHFIDLMTWLMRTKVVAANVDLLNKQWVKTKRSGFWDVEGILVLEFENGAKLEIESSEHHKSLSIELWQKNSLIYKVNEAAGTITDRTGLTIQEKYLNQSELTGVLLDELNQTDDCNLPTLNEAVEFNNILIEALYSHWKSWSGEKSDTLPVT